MLKTTRMFDDGNRKPNPKIKEYAGGWITEREGTDVPPFLKLAYIVIAGGCLAYFFLYMNGEIGPPRPRPAGPARSTPPPRRRPA